MRRDVKDQTCAVYVDSAENPAERFDKLSMNGKSQMIMTAPPFVLRLSKDERRVFQQNPMLKADPRLPNRMLNAPDL